MPMKIRLTTLPGGVRVATSAMDSVQSIALGIWVGVGGRYERAAMSGASHFIEHLLFKGTTRRSARDISRAIEGRGGYLNAFTAEDVTCFFARTSSDHAWSALDVLSDMYRHPRFDPADIEKERGVIIEEIMMYRDQPEQVVQELLGALLWKDHELGRPLIGSPETLRGLTRGRILAFKAAHYVPANTCFVCAGRICHEAFAERVAAVTRGLRGRPAPAFRRCAPRAAQGRLAAQTKPIEQAQMALGFRTFGRFDPRRYTLKLLNVILGESMSSRLFQAVRERHGLAYSIHSGTQLYAETGALIVSAGLDRRRQLKAFDLIVRELRRLKRDPVPARELARAKEYVLGHLRLALENPSGHMSWLGEHLLHYGTTIQPEPVMEAIQAVSADALRRLANDVFRADASSLAWLTPARQPGADARCQALLSDL